VGVGVGDSVETENTKKNDRSTVLRKKKNVIVNKRKITIKIHVQQEHNKKPKTNEVKMIEINFFC
jgi:hypothetical protein